jgi:hypothetical protein
VQAAVDALKCSRNKLSDHKAIPVRQAYALVSINSVIGRGDEAAGTVILRIPLYDTKLEFFCQYLS